MTQQPGYPYPPCLCLALAVVLSPACRRRTSSRRGQRFGLAYALLPPLTSGQAVGALVAGIASIMVSFVTICFGLVGAADGWGALVAGAFGDPGHDPRRGSGEHRHVRAPVDPAVPGRGEWVRAGDIGPDLRLCGCRSGRPRVRRRVGGDPRLVARRPRCSRPRTHISRRSMRKRRVHWSRISFLAGEFGHCRPAALSGVATSRFDLGTHGGYSCPSCPGMPGPSCARETRPRPPTGSKSFDEPRAPGDTPERGGRTRPR